jgi:CBS domain-containing protein
MTAEVITVESTQTMEHCMQIMTDHRVRHLPIMDKQQVKGLISIGDVVKEMMAHQKTIIEQLHSYIAG